ncbi:MAG TPA: PQQ-dependent sugar dehydrogenase, partial [Candidatus Limnocylindria bacterium]|nr:PQQ-dependent sugar dehydrogenase [Candidatus Limnocylindria bacterium]
MPSPTRPVLAAVVAVLALGACSAIRTSTPSPVGTVSLTSPATASATPGTGGPAATPGATAAPGNPDHVAITLEPFATVSGGPLAITAPDDGTGRLFVAVQAGQVWVVEADGTVLEEPLVDLGPRTRGGGEQGLLGLAVHPTFPTDPRVFANYTDSAGDSVVASLALDPGNPNRLDLASHRQLLFLDQPYSNHNGGGVVFGPDGKLYLSFGDGGSGGDPQGNGQRLDTLLGKILRIDIDGEAGEGAYGIPSDNPFAAADGLDEIWHYGLRNPWRMSFDRDTGDLWIGDVGQSLYEEVDVARGGVGGLNFGWNVMEGRHCYGADTCATEGLTLPVTDYGRDLGCTVIGGYVYRGSDFPFLRGTYLFADYCSGNIFAIDAAASAVAAAVVVGSAANRISAFG